MKNLNKVLVVGAGTMGAGIAQWFLQAGIEKVAIVDINKDQTKKATLDIQNSFSKLLEKGKVTNEEVKLYGERLFRENFDNLAKDYDLVIEAIVENFEIKKKLFEKLDEWLQADCIFASNTSSLSISKMAGIVSAARKPNFIGLHFFNPAPIMKLVEVIEGAETKANLAEDLSSFFKKAGKVPAICKDRPGFIVNRVARSFYGEGLRTVNINNSALIKEHDEALKAVGGFKMGPFELMDLIGIDVNLDVTESVWHSFNNDARFAPHRLQQEMVTAGFFGKKNKKGFYSYE